MNEQVKGTRCAIWARTSTTDQETENQMAPLWDWARARGLDVVKLFEVQDSAYTAKNGKGSVFERQRQQLLEGVQQGDYEVILVWNLDRLSRRGITDTIDYVKRVWAAGGQVYSRNQSWLEEMSGQPMLRELLIAIFAWLNQAESAKRSEAIRAGLARRAAEGKPVGRQPGAVDKRKRRTDAYHDREDRKRRERQQRGRDETATASG
jgi:putative DNA-invertase from lambdoid prophage Rac